MPLTPEQIQGVVSYYTGHNIARSQTIAGITRDRISTAARFASGGGGAIAPSGGGGGGLLGSGFRRPGMPGGKTVLSELMEEDPTGSQTPMNTTQWILNALSGPLYSGARYLEGIGSATEKAITPEAIQGMRDNPIGQSLTNLGTGFTETVGGAARGIAEGFGARFDNERPRTQGQNLESIGATKAIEDFAGSLTLKPYAGSAVVSLEDQKAAETPITDTGSHFWDNKATYGGLAGFAADVVGDPLSWVSGAGLLRAGTGLLKGGRTAVTGVGEALRAGEKLPGALVTGFHEGNAARSAYMDTVRQASLEREAAKSQRQAAQGAPATTLEDRIAAEQAARQATPAPAAAADLIDDVATPARPGTTGAPAGVADEILDPRMAAVQSLLPNLRTTPRDVPAGQIMEDARAAAGATLTESAAGTIRAAIRRPDELDSLLESARKSPEGARFLNTEVTFGGRQITMENLVAMAANRRVNPNAKEGELAMHAVTAAMGAAVKPRMAMLTPETLGAALSKNLDDAPNVDLPDIVQRMIPATPDERIDILRMALGGDEPTSFATFDDALDAAVGGQVEASMMRDMLTALGIKSAAKTDSGLRKALTARGYVEWETLRNTIPTEREVLSRADIDVETQVAAAKVDARETQATAATEADEAIAAADAAEANFVEGTVGSPLPAPKVGSGTTMGRILAEFGDVTPHTIEQAGIDGWLQMPRSVLQSIRTTLNRVRLGHQTGLTGAARADAGYDLLMARLTAGEAWLRSQGAMPYLKFGEHSKPLYVSFGQILEALPADVVKRSFFDLDYRLSKFGRGSTEKAAKEYTRGLTILPTTFANGVERALLGGTADDIFEYMNVLTKKQNGFAQTEAGQAALREIANAMDNPAFIDDMRTLHEAQEVVALAFIYKAADDIVAPVAEHFITAVARYGDRSEVMAAVRQALKETARISPEADDSLLRSIVAQRTDNGILNSLGQTGVAIARADTKIAPTDSVATQLTRQEAVNAKVKSGAKKPKRDKAAEATKRSETAVAVREAMDEGGSAVDDVMDVIDDSDVEFVRTMVQSDMMLGFARPFAKLGRMVFGDWGMGRLKSLQTQFQSASFQFSEDYVEGMRNWLHGGKTGHALSFNRRPKQEGLDARLSADLGHSVDDAEITTHLQMWWTALARHEEAFVSKVKVVPGRKDLRQALLAGQARNVRANLEPVAPLTEAQADMALELHDMIDEVFAPVDGLLGRSGITTADLAADMQRFGFGREGWSSMIPDEGVELADLAGLWRTYDMTLIDNPLDVLANWHKAVSATNTKVTIGASMSKTLDHKFFGMTAAEARSLGWKKFASDDPGSIVAHYVDRDSYFGPETFREVTHLEEFFRSAGKPEGNETIRRFVVAPYDYVTGILKASMTIWNPAHHVGNVLGENAMLLLDNVNPAYSIRAGQVIRAGGELGTVPDDVIAKLHANFIEAAGKESDGSFIQRWTGETAGNVRLAMKDGDVVEIPAGRLWQEAQKRGVTISAHEARDLLPGGRTAAVMQRRKFRLWQRLNPFSRITHKLGEFSATRDNFTRLAHFMAVLERGQYKNLEEAFDAAATKVHEFHPTVQSLSAFDQKYTRRLILFHTWVRMAASVVVRTALENPAAVTLPSKLQYNMAEANGLEPESIGKPIPNDPRIPGYLAGNVNGPQFTSGYGPFGDESDLPDGEEPHSWGLSLSTPQLDALYALFGGIPMGQDPLQTVLKTGEGIADNINPLIKDPAEILLHSKVGGVGGDPNDDLGTYLASQSGAPYRVAGALGLRADPDKTDEENLGEQQRLAFNWLAGLKTTDFTSETGQAVAEGQRQDWVVQYLLDQGYSKEYARMMANSFSN